MEYGYLCFGLWKLTTFSFYRAPREDHQLSLAPRLGLPLCQAFVEFENGNCDKAVDLLYPIRYELVQVGGSDAQVKEIQKRLFDVTQSPFSSHHEALTSSTALQCC